MTITESSPGPLRSDAERQEILKDPAFGVDFSDHMITQTWHAETGWAEARLTPVAPLSLHPAASVLHYGQEIFEGLKAYRHADDSLWLFRPERNEARMNDSAMRLALPQLPPNGLVDAVSELVAADHAWVPAHGGEASLYLRPYMIATEAFLGVRASREVLFGVLASPSGPYFPGGVRGIRLWLSSNYARAAVGGTGAAKCGGNYAASLLPQVDAREKGCDQVLYTVGAGAERRIDESGTMNVFALTADRTLITPRLGTILPGITRDSLITLAPEHGVEVQETIVGADAFLDDIRSGRITELFAAGTAAVITPITGVRSDDVDLTVGDGQPGAFSMELREHLTHIQQGLAEDKHGWMRKVC